MPGNHLLVPTRQVAAPLGLDSVTLLKTIRDGGRAGLSSASFAAVRASAKAGPGRSSRSQTALTYRERTPTDLESVFGNTRENGPTAAPNGIGRNAATALGLLARCLVSLRRGLGS